MISLVRQRLLNPTTGYQAVRTLLTNQQIGMDKFVSNKELNIRINKSTLVSNIKSALENDTMVYSDDLKSFAHSVDTLEDGKLLKDAFVKFAQNSESARISTFKMGPVLTRAFYHIDDLESLSELVNNETTAEYFHLRSAYMVYMNFMYQKEKFDQVFEYGEKVIARMLSDTNFFRSVESDNVVSLYLAAATKISSEEVLNKARATLVSYKTKVAGSAGNNNGKLRLKQVMLYHLLCVKNGKFAEALESMSEFSHMPHYEFLNAKAIVLARLGRLDECLLTIDGILNSPQDKPKFVFTETIQQIQAELEKTPHEQLKAKLESLDKELILDASIEDRILALPNSYHLSNSRGRNQFGNRGRFDDRQQFGNRGRFDDRPQFGNRGRFDDRQQFGNQFGRQRFGGGGAGGDFDREERSFDYRQGSNFNRFGDRPQYGNRPQFGNRGQPFGNRFNRFDDAGDDSFAEGSRRPFRPFQTRFKEEQSDII